MVVFDASPLILLAKIELLERFFDTFPEPVVIPPAVQVECCENKESFDAQMIARLINDKHIAVRKLGKHGAFEKIRREFSLGIGEAEAIALAHASKAKLIVIEDKNGVNACKILRLPFTGVLGILIRMREKELVSREEAVRKLEALQKFGRYRAELIEDVKLRLEAKK
jgi:predicted nucleic acid-binding protein